MIDGVYPSQFAEIEAMRWSHYRKLHDITVRQKPTMSHLPHDFLRMTQKKKTNHVLLA